MSVLKESTVSLLADVLLPTVLSLAFGIFTETLIKSVLITYYLLLITYLAKTILGTTVYVYHTSATFLPNCYRCIKKKLKKMTVLKNSSVSLVTDLLISKTVVLIADFLVSVL